MGGGATTSTGPAVCTPSWGDSQVGIQLDMEAEQAYSNMSPRHRQVQPTQVDLVVMSISLRRSVSRPATSS